MECFMFTALVGKNECPTERFSPTVDTKAKLDLADSNVSLRGY